MKIAIWLHGGIGGGNFSQGQPSIVQIIKSLSHEHSITVYSVLPANKGYVAETFSFRTPARWITNIGLRYFCLAILFLSDHFKNRFEIIHAFWAYPAGTFAVILGNLIGIPSIVTLQGGESAAVPEINYGNMLRPGIKKITLWTCERATCLNSISYFLIQQLQHYGLKRNDVYIIPFGADTGLFKFNSKQRAPLLRIIHVANLTEVKDQLTLLKAFDIIRKQIPSHLTIIGGDYLNGQIHRYVTSLGFDDHVTFISETPHNLLYSYYAKADIMMHTSLHEGMGSVIVEAMASGVVICGTKVGILSDQSNLFKTVQPKDFELLAKEVINLWKNQKHYLALQALAHEWAVKHDLRWTVGQYSTLYIKIGKVNDG